MAMIGTEYQGNGPALAVERLTKSFGSVKAVDDVSFSVAAGEFLTLLGPSGSGKTTILRLLGGFEYADGGSIMLGGSIVERLPPYKRNIGVVFQKYALFPHMTVAQNIAFPLKQRKVPAAERERLTSEVLELVGLEGLGSRFPRQLSGGQQQRVALARAIVFKPSILLMDEPLGALDKKLRERMQREIRALQKRVGITAVYVTHDQSEAMTMSDKVAVLHRGRIEQLGTPLDLYEHPATEFVAGFIGDSNLLPGTVVGRSEGIGELRLADGTSLRFPWRDGLEQEVLLLVRPEKLEVEAVDNVSSGKNLLRGQVLDATYYGESTLLEIEAAGHRFSVRQANRRASPSVRPGDRVHVTWAPEDCAAVPPGKIP